MGPKESRDFIVGNFGDTDDAVHERRGSRVFGVEEGSSETLGDAVDNAEEEERECMGGEGNACQLVGYQLWQAEE